MNFTELATVHKKWLDSHWSYKLIHWSDFNYNILSNIMYKHRAGRGSNKTYNDCLIMADTETSKKYYDRVCQNHVVAWTISIRSFNTNIVTLYGHRPDSMVNCINKLLNSMSGEDTFIYFHNLAYDWVFIRKFLFREFGLPEKQLNTKSHYPIYIRFFNGLILKDSLILAQRSLDKWANDLDVEHKKSIGKWDYDKIRTQREVFSSDELEYIEHDTLAGVECLQKTIDTLGKSIYSIPYTATGIPREEVRQRGKAHNAHERFLSMAFSYDEQVIAERVYHGGYTHANRHMINTTITDTVTCYDFASSYPFVMISEKFPMEKFTPINKNVDIDYILYSKNYAFMFCLILIRPRLKDDFVSMPALQYSKCTKIINPVLDNGRILCAEYVEIYLTELDLEVINSQYDYDKHICTDVYYAYKEYLPRWFTDYVFELFEAKTKLKNGDKVAYSLAKAKLNSLYGMCVQKPIKQEIVEQYLTGEYTTNITDPSKLYDKYINRINTILPYQWGVWVTAYAFRNLFRLGSCCDTWVYSDTDSCYGIGWNNEKLDNYNNECKQKLLLNGYNCVNYNNRDYWLGVAELDGSYSEYRVQGAKRYCGRSISDGELHITVAGVPKAGYKCLKDNINNFAPNLIFSGAVTGKKTHTYFFVDDIYTDSKGNITGDSIDLSPCDYLLDSEESVDWERIFTEEIEVQVYE